MHDEGVGAGVAELAAAELVEGHMLRFHPGVNVLKLKWWTICCAAVYPEA